MGTAQAVFGGLLEGLGGGVADVATQASADASAAKREEALAARELSMEMLRNKNQGERDDKQYGRDVDRDEVQNNRSVALEKTRFGNQQTLFNAENSARLGAAGLENQQRLDAAKLAQENAVLNENLGVINKASLAEEEARISSKYAKPDKTTYGEMDNPNGVGQRIYSTGSNGVTYYGEDGKPLPQAAGGDSPGVGSVLEDMKRDRDAAQAEKKPANPGEDGVLGAAPQAKSDPPLGRMSGAKTNQQSYEELFTKVRYSISRGGFNPEDARDLLKYNQLSQEDRSLIENALKGQSNK